MSRLRLREVHPRLAATIAGLLGVDPLAGTVGDLFYFGVCGCSTTCRNLLTAPPGSASPRSLALSLDGAEVIGLSLDPTGMFITDIEVLDPALYGRSAEASGNIRPRPESAGRHYLADCREAGKRRAIGKKVRQGRTAPRRIFTFSG